jgi:DNA primase
VALISEDQIDQIRTRADIYQIISERMTLKRAGRNWKSPCPFHQEKTPSFVVSPEKQIFHCFGCGAGGNVFHFLMRFEGWSFVEAVRHLADRLAISLEINEEEDKKYHTRKKEKDILYRVNRLAAKYYFAQIKDASLGDKARRYLEKRGLNQETAQKYVLGYASASGRDLVSHFEEKKIHLELGEKLGLLRKNPEGRTYDFFRDRLMFPIFSPQGQVLGFSSRTLKEGEDSGPKYLNSPDSPVYNKSETAYGLYEAREAMRTSGQVFMVEGNLDCLMMAQKGFENVVAPLGTAVTSGQIRLLSRYVDEFIVLFDGDQAGTKAAIRALPLFLDLNVSAKQLTLPAGEDPDSFLQDEAGPQKLSDKAKTAPPLMEAVMMHLWDEADHSTQGKAQFIQQVLPYLRQVTGESQRGLYIRKLADFAGAEEAWIWKELKETSSPAVSQRSQAVKPLQASPMEKRFIEIVLNSHKEVVAPLVEDLTEQDFDDEGLKQVWNTIKKVYQKDGPLSLSSVLEAIDEGPYRQWLESVAIEWMDLTNESQTVTDCLKHIRKQRVRGQIKTLKTKLARAEQEHDEQTISQLMQEQNFLLKQMASY